MGRLMTQQEVIDKAYAHHGDKYDYSTINYINQGYKITVICKTHGEFTKWPKDFINGSGCKKCADEAYSKSRRMPLDDFKHKAATRHKGFYTYDNVTYINNSAKVEIGCPTHGNFWQEPWVHLSGSKCPLCAKNKQQPMKFYVNEAIKTHGTKYDYTQAFLTNSFPFMPVICKTHGLFTQKIHDHIRGSGCPKCSTSGFLDTKPATLYYLNLNDGQAYKIGITNKTVEARFSVTELSSITVIFTITDSNGKHIKDAEKYILDLFKHNKYTGPKLLTSGNTELFSTNIFNNTIPKTLKDIYDNYKSPI